MIMKVESTRLLCEEAQRQVLFHLFALAGTIRLQAQCEELQIATYSSSFEDRQQVYQLIHSDGDHHLHTDDGDEGCRRCQCFYALKALHIYLISINMIKINRATIGMIAMLKIQAGGDDDSDGLMNNGMMLPHGPEGFHLCWSVDDDLDDDKDGGCGVGDVVEVMDNATVGDAPVINSSIDTCTIDLDGSDRSGGDNDPFNSSPWRSCSSSYNIIGSNFYSDLQRSLLNISSSIQPHRFIALNKSVQLQFSHSKRLTAITVQDNIQSYLIDYCCNAPTASTSRSSSSSSSSTSNIITSETYIVLLMPAVIHLQVAIGNSDIFMTTETIIIELPYIDNPHVYESNNNINNSNNNNNNNADSIDSSACDSRRRRRSGIRQWVAVGEEGGEGGGGGTRLDLLYSKVLSLSSSHRAKRWRIRISRVHPYFIVCRRSYTGANNYQGNNYQGNSNNRDDSIDEKSVAMTGLSFRWMDSTSLTELKKSVSSTTTIETMLSFTCRLSEAAFDVDALQVSDLGGGDDSHHYTMMMNDDIDDIDDVMIVSMMMIIMIIMI